MRNYAYIDFLNVCMPLTLVIVFSRDLWMITIYAQLFQQEWCHGNISLREIHMHAYICVGQQLGHRCKVVEWNAQISHSLPRGIFRAHKF